MAMKHYIVLALAVMLTACNASDRYGKDVDTVDVADLDTVADEPVIDESTLIEDSTETKKDSTPSLEIPPRRDMTYDAVMNRMRTSPDWSKYQQGILPKMASDCLEYADRLLNNTHDYFIVVDKASMNVLLYDKYGREVKVYRTACSRNYGTKHKKADNRTPEGFFVAQGIYDSTDWLYTNDYGVTSPARGQFGPRFIRLKTTVTSQVGIHGTASPGSLGRRVSHGLYPHRQSQHSRTREVCQAGNAHHRQSVDCRHGCQSEGRLPCAADRDRIFRPCSKQRRDRGRAQGDGAQVGCQEGAGGRLGGGRHCCSCGQTA